ncbi:Uncharacterised protein [Mycobacteroides abscessus subsp. abscessus]|nr:Uncharacterised protein [Mycobacteroides abscessus subsp. abscessus]
MRDRAQPGDSIFPNARWVFSDVIFKSGIAIWQRPCRMRRDHLSIHVRKTIQGRVVVGPQKVIPRPGCQQSGLGTKEFRGHQSTCADRRCPGPVSFVVRHHGKIDQNHLSPCPFQIQLGNTPKIHHGRPRDDGLPRGPADARAFARASLRVSVDIHARHPKPLAPQSRTGFRRTRGGKRRVGRRSHSGCGGNLDPRLHAPEVTACFSIVGDNHIEHLEHVGHGTRMRHHHVHGGDQRPITTH